MGILHFRKVQTASQPALPQRLIQQVSPTDDFCHALRGIITHHSQLITDNAIAPPKYQIPPRLRQIFSL